MIETGTILQNRYRIDEKIGQGGMGNVYVATDERFKSRVAIKETIFEDANLRRAFEREARLLNSLKHVALPRVSDHFDDADGQFLVMEFIAGEDLAERMEKNGEAFPLEIVLDWAYQLCDALDYLHAQDIIHRDIKPQNLKLTPGGQIVLLDFGLAKGNATDAAHQTAAKSIFGFSRNYASLEQIQGAGTEPRSDLYSLSATLYHLLTGIPPADALTRAMNVLNKQSDPLVPANLINKLVPRGVAEVLQKAMALNANERPESAASMREMLEASDKSIDLFAADSIIEKSLAADFLTQETKIMGAKTNVSADGESEVKTKIAANVSGKQSYETRITGGSPESALAQSSRNTESPRRSKAVAAAILLGLFLIGSVLSAGYFMSSGSSDAGTVNGENAPNQFVGTSENANVSNTNVELVEQQPANEAQPKQAETVKSDSKETKKQSPNSQAAIKSGKTNSGENIVINGESIEMGDVIMDDNGIRDRKTGKSLIPVPPESPESPEETPSLSPEQIRRLRQLTERLKNNKKRVIVVKTPTPPPTP